MASYAYVSIPLSVSLTFLLSFLFLGGKNKEINVPVSHSFPKRFFSAAIVAGIASTAFLTFDIILVKHFLSPELAGQYGLIALVGKMVYFLGSLPNAFLISLVSLHEGKNLNPTKIFYQLFSITCLLTFSAFLVLGIFGDTIVPVLLGEKTVVILPYLPLYALAMAFFTLSSTIVSFHLVRRNYLFPVVAIAMAAILSLLIGIFHTNIGEIVQVIFYTSLLSLGSITLLHFLVEKND